MEFKDFKEKIQEQFQQMSGGNLFRTAIEKDDLWDTYLNSFPPGTNEIFRERREYDCQCCKQFIRVAGNIVAINGNRLISIWDIEIGGTFQVVADAMSALVKSAVIRDAFFHDSKSVGTDFNFGVVATEQMKWDHFYLELPKRFVKKKDRIPTRLGEIRSGKDVFKRGLEQITVEAAETVFELIDQNSLYRGEEFKPAVEIFLDQKAKFDATPPDAQDNYCWLKASSSESFIRIRNTAIGTLLVDLSENVDLDNAVRMFESKVAPTNYKRPTALITKSMIQNAEKKTTELGIVDSLNRRYAVAEDLTINNVIFADRTARKVMKSAFDELIDAAPANLKSFDKVEEVSIKNFVEKILPRASTVEILFENRHSSNLVSLIAPVIPEAKPIFKWGNNFSWAYKGEVADSIKERVKSAGGNVEGVLRFSIQWNDDADNENDFDAHCHEPDGNLIYYSSMRNRLTTGELDVDIINPDGRVAVENITWTDKNRMAEGKYIFLVHNYSHRGGKSGFTAEIEFDGQIHSYSYAKELRQGEKVTVAEINFSRADGISFIKSLPHSYSAKEIWGISTQQFRKVSMVLNSPNHWNGTKVGNKHFFFILEDCKNEDRSRGFFNEFLKEDLREHRKVFEVLGSKMKTEKSDKQLSGIGFSSTQRNHIVCKVSGAFDRTIQVNF